MTNDRNSVEYWFEVAQEAIARLVAQESIIKQMSKVLSELQMELVDTKRKLKEIEDEL